MTGIKPTDLPHIGNLMGMMEPAIALQDSHEAYYFIGLDHVSKGIAFATIPDPPVPSLGTSALSLLAGALAVIGARAVSARRGD